MRQAEVIRICPYCGNEYGARIVCCGESMAHGVYAVDGVPALADETYETKADALAAIEACEATEMNNRMRQVAHEGMRL